MDEPQNVAEATRLQQVHRVAEWLAEGRDVNAQDQQGNTALHWSCLLGLQSLTSLLLAHEARTDIRNEKGSYAVHAAVSGRNVPAMKLLSGEKSSQTSRRLLLLRDAKGLTAFLAAAEINDDVYMMEWLYLQGAALDQRSFKGETAAQIACREGHTRTLQWLISHNASVLERDNSGQTAFHSACAAGCHDAIKMLLDATPQREIRTDGFSCALQHGQRCLALWLICADVVQAAADSMACSSAVRDALSRSAWVTVFWCLLLLNFACFLATAPQQHLLWFVWLAVVLLWFQLAMSDPGYTGARLTVPGSTIQEEKMELPATEQVNELKAAWAQLQHGVTSFQAPQWVHPTNTSRSSRSFRRMEELEEPESPKEMSLQAIERRALQLSREQQRCWQLMEKLQRTAPASELSELRQLDGQMESYAASLMDEAGAQRLKEIMAESGEYAHLAAEGDFRRLCVICRRLRSMRSFHCKICGSCVQRMDHHCPWVDRCIGLQNQRSFYIFLLLLAVLFGSFMQTSVSFLLQASAWQCGALALVLLCDLPAMLFVLALILRQTVYMLVNVTTYEVLVCPPHVCSRFPRRGASCWYLDGFSWRSALRNLTCYWTLDMSKDGSDFEVSEASAEELYEQVVCCGPLDGYRQAGELIEEAKGEKLNSRTMVVPSRNLSL